MYNQQQMPGYGFQQQQQFNGYGYRPMEQPKMVQGLTKEEQNYLRNKAGNQFAFTAVSKDDLLASKCTHKYNGQWDCEILDPASNLVECRTCHERFHIFDGTAEEVNAIVTSFIDILQTAKYLYVDIKPELAEQFFQIIPLAKQAGTIYNLGKQNLSKYDGMNNVQQNNDQYGFAALNGLMQPQMGYGMPYGQPPMGAYPQQPQMPQMPQASGNPFYAQQAAPMPGYGMPQYQQPQQFAQPGYGYPQQQMQPVAQPIAPTNGDNAEQPKTVEVNKTYNV